LYFIFIIALFVILLIPADIKKSLQVSDTSALELKFTNGDLTAFVFIVKLVLVVLTLIPLILAWVLRKSKKKTAIIQAAFHSVDEMKTDFDKAISSLKL